MRPDQSNDPEAPEALISALRKMPSEPVFVPQSVDQTILREARKHLAPEPRPRFSWLLWPSLATVCLVVALLVRSAFQPSPAEFAREDVNRDGMVDILDAFDLARQLQTDQAAPRALDFNSDGVLDNRDVEFIAAEAVKLEKGGRS